MTILQRTIGPAHTPGHNLISLTEQRLGKIAARGHRIGVTLPGRARFDSKKPNPEGLLRIMKKRGISPAESLMVGDSVNDILAGQGAGVTTCGVSYGLGAKGFAEHSPDFTIDRFPELFHRIRPIR